MGAIEEVEVATEGVADMIVEDGEATTAAEEAEEVQNPCLTTHPLLLLLETCLQVLYRWI